MAKNRDVRCPTHNVPLDVNGCWACKAYDTAKPINDPTAQYEAARRHQRRR